MIERTFPIYTERLCLRRFTMSDVDYAYDNWMSDPDVTEFLTWNRHKNREETEGVIKSWTEAYASGTMDWCITLRKDKIPVGSITAVQDFPRSGYCELGYCLSKELWNRGIMTEALKAVTERIFAITDYWWIQAHYDIENGASGRCLEKAGFREFGSFEQISPKTGMIRNQIMMRIDRKIP